MSELLDRTRRALQPRYRDLTLLEADSASLHARAVAAGGEERSVHALSPSRAGVDGERLARALRELARLEHERLLPVLEVGADGDLVWMVSPHMVGAVSLRTWLDREGRLPFLEAVRVLREVAEGLVHAHAVGSAHLDLRPERILWHGAHARVEGVGVRQALIAAGLPPSPAEQAGTATDLVQLGALGYEVLTGRVPAESTGSPSPALLRKHVPPGLARVVARCLESGPGRAAIDATEVSRLLDGLVTPAQGYEAAFLENQAAYLERRGKHSAARERRARTRAGRGAGGGAA